MHPISGTLQTTVFGQLNIFAADLWTFTLQDGTLLRYTDGDVAVVYGGNTFSPFAFQGGDYQGKLGSEISSFEVVLYPGAATIGAIPYLTAARYGAFDRARVKVERAFGATYPTAPSEVVGIFSGVVTESVPGSASVTLGVRSLSALLEEPMPRRIVVPACPFVLGDADCKVNLATWTSARTAAAGTTDSVIVLSSSTTNAVVGSTVRVTSGTYAGQRRLVRAVAGVTLTLDSPLPSAPAVGDGVSIVRGCAKTVAECDGTFANRNPSSGLRHGGYPWAPLKTSKE